MRLLLCSLLLFLPYVAAVAQFQMSTWSGNNYRGFEGPAKLAFLQGALFVSENSQGEILFTQSYDKTLNKVDGNGIIHLLAGVPGTSGDVVGLASEALFTEPSCLTVDANDDIYFADEAKIKKLNSSSGFIEHVGGDGNGNSYSSADENVSATSVSFDTIYGIAFSSGNIYVSDTYRHCIRKIDPQGMVSTIAGTCGSSGYANGAALSAQFNSPKGLAIHGTDMYVSDYYNYCVRKIANFETSPQVSDAVGSCQSSGDADNQVALNAQLDGVVGIAIQQNMMVIAEKNNEKVKMWNMISDEVRTIAGGGSDVIDGINPLQASLTEPNGIVVRKDGSIVFGEDANRVRIISSDLSSISIFAGDYQSEMISRKVAKYGKPYRMVRDPDQNIFLTDYDAQIIRTIFSNDTIHTAVSSGLNRPDGIDYLSTGQIVISDGSMNQISKVNSDGSLTTIGDGPLRFTGDGKQVLSTLFNNMMGGAYHPITKELWICDYGFNRVRKIGHDGIVTTMIGNGNMGSNNGAALSASIIPNRIAFKSNGDAYILANDGEEVRFYDSTTLQVSTTVIGWSGASRAESIMVDSNDNLLVLKKSGTLIKYSPPYQVLANTGNSDTMNFFRKSNGEYLLIGGTPNGKIWKYTPGVGLFIVAGSGTDITNDDIPVAQVRLGYLPDGIVCLSNGDIYYTDGYMNRMRKITASTGKVATLPAAGFVQAFRNIFLDPDENIIALDTFEHVIRRYNTTSGEWTVIGGGVGDRASAMEAWINFPSKLSVDRSTDDVYFFESSTGRLREISNGIINTLYRDSTNTGFTLTRDGSLLVAGSQITKVKNGEVISKWGKITTNQTEIDMGRLDGVPLDEAVFSAITDIIETSCGDFLFVEKNNHVVRLISDGAVWTVAGTFSQQGYSGDGQDSTLSKLYEPYSLLEVDDGILITDSGNGVIRKLNFVCYGVSSSGNACSGHGSCHCNGTCSCQSGYTGVNCEEAICYGLTTSEGACNGNGQCQAPDNCTCHADYFSSDCGVYCNANLNCSSNGVCDQTGQCSCNTDYYLNNCSVHCNAQTSCSGSGQCDQTGQCSCNNDYYLDDCSVHCNPQTSCDGHGQCSMDGQCTCNSDYYLSNCSVYCNAQSSCNGNGQCDMNGQCACNADYYLNDCSVHCDAQNTCHGNGQCDLNGQCVCLNGYTGTYCDVAPNNGGNNGGGSNNNPGITCFGILSNDSIVCNGHGNCQSNDQCSCHSSDQTGYWADQQCLSCQSGYEGVNCQIQTNTIGGNSIDYEDSTSQQHSLLYLLFLLLIIPVIILVIVVIVVMIVLVKRMKGKPKEKEADQEMAVTTMNFVN